MNHAGSVRRGQTTTGGDEDGDDLGEAPRGRPQPALQGTAWNIFHDDEDLVVGVDDLVDLDDVGMRDAGQRSRFS